MDPAVDQVPAEDVSASGAMEPEPSTITTDSGYTGELGYVPSAVVRQMQAQYTGLRESVEGISRDMVRAEVTIPIPLVVPCFPPGWELGLC